MKYMRHMKLNITTRTLGSALLFSALLTTCLDAAAELPAPSSVSSEPATEQAVVPEITRRDIKMPRLPSNDFEFGTYIGNYETQNFGSGLVTGLRFGYHISEDFFVEGVYAKTKVSDALFRQILPGGVFPTETQNLRYYNLSAGYNVLTGEVFFGTKTAKAMSLYVIGGVGSTLFNERRLATANFGTGVRMYFNDHIAVQCDAREHIFSVDLLGKRQSTRNLELTLGITGSF